jgi:hypothetical protein
MTIAAILCLPNCHKETEEEKIKNLIAGIQKAAGEKDTRTVLGHLSKTYHDPQGNNYDGIKGLLLFYFMRHRQVHVYVPNLDISIENNAAQASLQAVLTVQETSQRLARDLAQRSCSISTWFYRITKNGRSLKVGRMGEGPAPNE